MALKNAFKAYLTVQRPTSGVGSKGPAITNMAFDKCMGGKASQSEVKYQPAEGIQRTYVGIKTIENITLEVEYNQAIHGAMIPGQFDESDIRGLPCTVEIQDLVPSTGKYQKNRPPYKGVILEVTPPDYDSNDAASIVDLSVIVSVGEAATG